ncbi:MAG: sigma 54-interacting transcriptional regulator [SAR324 cluster bacterium]|nr:sigma 54-interacting transcriptional regulator [SAR324 cluster bacterium]
MRSSDLSIVELLKIDPKKGFPLFGSHRIIVTGIASLRRFGDDLNQGLGLDRMRIVLSRLGYENGLTAATILADMYHFDTQLEWFQSSKILMKMSGIVDQEITDLDYDPAQNHIQFKGIWHDSFEALNFSTLYADSITHPICCLLTGLLSGYASGVFGKTILVKETSCIAQGHPSCTFEGYSLTEQDEELSTFLKSMTLDPLDEDIARLKAELQKSREALMKRDAEIERLKKQSGNSRSPSGMIYRSKSMENLIDFAGKIALTDSPVLIQGESGTGKELIARFIHQQSNRSNDPFVAVNCAALPANLLESELFGYVKGAFTGADTHKKGLLLEAGKGTFFLDEVSELPMVLQAKLLRVLQEKEIRPVGGVRNIPIQVRIIAASNRDLKQMIEKGAFREDLFYRLAVFPLNIDPLRRRKDDILILARHFLNRVKASHPGFTPEAVRCLETHSWPGNIRELENCIEYASVTAPNEKITTNHLPPSISQPSTNILPTLSSDMPTLKELEQRYTQFILEHTQGNKSEASRILGIGVTTLWRHLQSR